jgi:hypothetical protein
MTRWPHASETRPFVGCICRRTVTNHGHLIGVRTRKQGEVPVQQQYEYKFVRLGEGIMQVRKAGKDCYQEAIHTHAAKGWRLVQIFAPGVGAYGAAKYYELIFERPVA